MERLANLTLSAGTFILGATVFFKSMTYTVDAGQRGLIFDRFQGVKEKIYGEGIHFFVPLLQVQYIYKYIYILFRIQLFTILDYNQKQYNQ